MDPCIKKMTDMLRLPDALKGFLACILKYIVSSGPGGGVPEGRSPERRRTQNGAQRVVGARKGLMGAKRGGLFGERGASERGRGFREGVGA